MAKSKLIANRKKSTVVVSKRSLEDAIRRANALASTWMEANSGDPRLEQIESIASDLSRYLKMTPQEMRQDGVSTIEEYFDDAVRPDIANKIKGEVNQIAKWHDEARSQHAQPAEITPERQGIDYVPEHATQVMSSEEEKVMADKKANGGAAFTTDRDEKGEAKMPEKVEVPRLAAKKKKEAEDPALDAAAPVPPVPPTPPAAAAPAPAPAATGSVNAIDYIPTETLIKVIGDLPKEDDFAQNQGKQDALIELTNVLKSRPVLPPEPVEGGEAAAPAAPAPAAGAIPPPVTASKKADYGDHRMDNSGTVNSGSGASSQIGQGGNTAAPEPISTNPAPNEAKIDLGGLTIASEEKTADDYRLHDYKLLDEQEGLVPTGQLPSMDEQADRMHPEGEMEMDACAGGMEASMEKEAVTPPGISEKLMHKLKDEYPGDKEKAYATAWSIHNKQTALKKAAFEFANEVAKIASAGGSGGWFVDGGEPMEVDEDGGRTPEIGEAHGMLEDNTSITRPATTEPIKLNEQQSLKTAAGDMSTSSAVKKSEALGNDLKRMYLEAKALTNVNDTRAVREAVEMIFRAGDAFNEATKALNKQNQQEESEAEAQEMKAKNKKSSSFGGLAVAAGE
jgi:hypothetical protein